MMNVESSSFDIWALALSEKRLTSLTASQRTPQRLRIVTCYIVNEARTKFLLHYDEWSRRWFPTDCPIKRGEAIKRTIAQYAFDNTGLEVRHLIEYRSGATELSAFILEADDGKASSAKLLNHYGVQWLNREEIQVVAHACETTKVFAELFLN